MNCATADFLIPDWPAPDNVRVLQTLRTGGLSQPPWNTFNLGDHVGDLPESVTANRALLRTHLPAEPTWLQQVHGTVAVDLATTLNSNVADAAFTRQVDTVCVVMTADCLPVLFCDRAGSVVAAAHAGWRGLLDGVLEETMARMGVPPQELLAWFGPAICPDCFEVGDEVRTAFVAQDATAESAFRSSRSGKWLANIYKLARLRLRRAGLNSISGGDLCTVSDPTRFFSYRRDGVTGRMASLIWLDSLSSGV